MLNSMDNQAKICNDVFIATNDVLASMPLNEAQIAYHQHHDRICEQSM